jgi:hypothetical protein
MILSFAGTVALVHGFFYAPDPLTGSGVVNDSVFRRYMDVAHLFISYHELCYVERLPLDFDVDYDV